MKYACAAVILLVCAIAGCCSQDHAGTARLPLQRDALNAAAKSVVAIESTAESFRASAVSLGGNRFLTNRHCLPDSVRETPIAGETIRLGGETMAVRPTFELRLNGATVSAKVVDRGACEKPEDDWAVFEVLGPDCEIPALPRDPSHQLVAGDEVVLLGFWKDPSGQIPSVISGRVTTPPLPWLSVPETIIPIETSYSEVYFGLSGGAAVVWDERHERYVLVGVYRGMRQWPLVLGAKLGVQAVRRLPEALK